MADEPILPILEETEEFNPQQMSFSGGGGDGSDDIAHWVSRAALSEKFLKAVVKPSNFKDFVTELLLEIVKTVKCEAASVIEVSEDRQSLFFRAATGYSSDRLDPIEIPITKGIAGHVVSTRQYYVMKTDKDPKQLKTVDNTVGFVTRNLIAIPILVRGNVYGVLELLNRVGDEDFSEKDIEILNFSAEMASKAIEIRLMFNWMAKSRKKAA